MFTDSTGRHVPTSIEELVPVLIRSGLATEQEAAHFYTQYRNEFLKKVRIPDTLTAFCSFLVAHGNLSTWQCWKLRQGQWKGFRLDDFVLVDFLDKDQECSYYLARNTRDDAFVCLAIVPMAHSKGKEIEYRIAHHF
jgi:hypothetical protein